MNDKLLRQQIQAILEQIGEMSERLEKVATDLNLLMEAEQPAETTTKSNGLRASKGDFCGAVFGDSFCAPKLKKGRKVVKPSKLLRQEARKRQKRTKVIKSGWPQGLGATTFFDKPTDVEEVAKKQNDRKQEISEAAAGFFRETKNVKH